jgi:uncharacterized BrkB/YihY/UPF0761 family membrane protein
VEPDADNISEELERPQGRIERARLWSAAAHARIDDLSARGQHERSKHASVDAVYEMVDRDGELGGGIIAGALAYRLFLWLLPLALVAVAGLGFGADATSESPTKFAGSVGLAGLVSQSVSNASNGAARWYALVVGIPILVYLTRSVLRALIGAHRILWGDVRAGAPKPTVKATLKLLVVMLGFFGAQLVAGWLRAHSVGLVGVVATLLAMLPYAGLWLLASIGLPHRGASWLTLVPGALLFGVCVEVLNIVAVYVFGPYAVAKQGTYGALGAAAALLLGLYFLSRIVVISAVLNATLWVRRERARST